MRGYWCYPDPFVPPPPLLICHAPCPPSLPQALFNIVFAPSVNASLFLTTSLSLITCPLTRYLGAAQLGLAAVAWALSLGTLPRWDSFGLNLGLLAASLLTLYMFLGRAEWAVPHLHVATLPLKWALGLSCLQALAAAWGALTAMLTAPKDAAPRTPGGPPASVMVRLYSWSALTLLVTVVLGACFSSELQAVLYSVERGVFGETYTMADKFMYLQAAGSQLALISAALCLRAAALRRALGGAAYRVLNAGLLAFTGATLINAGLVISKGAPWWGMAALSSGRCIARGPFCREGSGRPIVHRESLAWRGFGSSLFFSLSLLTPHSPPLRPLF